jgi:hypothetical protein
MWFLIVCLIPLCFVLLLLKMVDKETSQNLKRLAKFMVGLFVLWILLALLSYITHSGG